VHGKLVVSLFDIETVHVSNKREHFIGNRAIDLASGETELQIEYSSGYTALSFFMPIIVLLAAFVAIGTNNTVSWWRVTAGGVLAGAAICGMHYLGNASIDNYACVYNPVNVVGAALISVAASIVALSIFFVFRAAWTSSWWKRLVAAVVLAGAASGMHWCAAIGTEYRLIRLNSASGSELSRNVTVIVVICLVGSRVARTLAFMLIGISLLEPASLWPEQPYTLPGSEGGTPARPNKLYWQPPCLIRRAVFS
jgi:NO-binding membrane sensor protein with MHYT domain